MGTLYWVLMIVGIVILIIVILSLIKVKDDEDEGIWAEAGRIGRGACAKITEFFGC